MIPTTTLLKDLPSVLALLRLSSGFAPAAARTLYISVA
jgi:hypothetical protein